MKTPNKWPRVDAGRRVLFAFQCSWPGATQAERYLCEADSP
jgi:hypothetical protein